MVSNKKVEEVRAELEAQKKRVLALKKQRDEANVLTQELTSTQLDYNNIRQRLNQSSLESQNQQTSVTVLTPAFEPDPDKPSFPKLWLNLILAIILGGLLGAGLAVLKELKDPKIRSEEDLALLGIPVLGVFTLAQPSSPRWKIWPRQWQFWSRPKISS